MALVVWSDPAREDLRRIASTIARDSPAYARAWAERLRRAVGRLADFPSSGRILPEDATKALREVIVGNYRVIYRPTQVEVTVLAVVHGARLLDLP